MTDNSSQRQPRRWKRREKVSSENSIFIPVYFKPNTKGEKEEILTISSNDSGRPTIVVNLKSICIAIVGDIKGDNQIDITDVIKCLRMVIGLDEKWLRGDMNNDGIGDITDVIRILRKAIGFDL